jgi:hypothetical protein
MFSLAGEMAEGPGSVPSGPAGDSSSDLLEYLFSGYDKRIRPFSDQQRPVIIEMTIVLAILTELVGISWQLGGEDIKLFF